jgi:hypothetical protein
MEAEREPRRLVVSVNEEEAKNLHQVLAGVVKA